MSFEETAQIDCPKRLRDVCYLPEDEKLWRAGRGFVVRDLKKTGSFYCGPELA